MSHDRCSTCLHRPGRWAFNPDWNMLTLHALLPLRMFRQKHRVNLIMRPRSTNKKTLGDYNFSQPSFKLNTMKQGPALLSMIRTREEQHDNTGIHANSWFWDQSTQMASWQLAYCWIIHSLHQAWKKSSMGPGYSAFFPPLPVYVLPKQLLTKMWHQMWLHWRVCSFPDFSTK